jgi:ParB family chromosome partitioning protein
VPPERAFEISIAENSGREPLHPADEFDAFKALIDEGKGIEDVAARFGVSVLTVQRRLKLAAVSPKLLDMYRADDGTINLDQLMALAVSDDHAAQERAWDEAQPWDRAPAALKRKLTADAVAASGNALVRFVGIAAYEAAGGVVRRDLFDDEQSRFLSDPALLQQLVTDKLDGMATELRAEGWAWVETCVRLDPQAMRQFTPCRHDVRKPTRQERDELSALATRGAELDQQAQALEDAAEWSEDEAERIDLEQQCIAVRRHAIQEARMTWSPDVKAHAGALLTVDREGEAAVMRGLMRDADRKAVAVAFKAADEVEGQGLDAIEVTPTNRPAQCSQSLAKRLAAHRTVALQVMLSRSTPVALAALAHLFVTRVFGETYGRGASALQIAPQLSAYALEAAADDIKDSRAWRALDASKQDWMARLPEQQDEWFAWLIDLPQGELLDLLALCAALTLNALPGSGSAADANAIAEALNLDMADWWEVGPQSYMNHVSKVQIVQALNEAEPGQSHEVVGALKKGALVATATARLADKRWLPTLLRRPPG